MKLLIIFALAAVTLASKGLHKKTNDPLEGEAVSKCSPEFAEKFCLNGGTCFVVKILDSKEHACKCPGDYIGLRCEYKSVSINQ
ncbi:U-actitoxin-Avd12b [Exaiptasia diaphana]|uniref:EGF-like domain-containing protein n=1 Tax=Exaiptasia diaphana TaxID=2652724 RepID=A0A913XG00_EXADI|nr:U-actitoxin-Avd12b [Exaiptasia diaphana]